MNVMSCSRCGKPVNAASAFCPHCGQPLRQTAPPTTVAANAMIGATALQQAYESQKKRNLIIGLSVGAAVLILAIIFGMKTGALGLSGSNPDNKVLNARGSLPPSTLALNGSSGPAVLSQPAVKPPDSKMPDDVYNWLKHLEKCEAMKVEIAGDQAAEVQLWMQKFQVLGPGMSMMDPYDQNNPDNGDDKAPGSYASGKVQDLRPKWDELLNFFHSVPPPAECQPTADDFDRAIREIPGMMGDISDILNSADADPQSMMKKAKKMQNGSYGDIDRYFNRCDQKVSDLCMKYKVSKWFNIKGDVTAGGMMGKFSSLGF